MSSWLALFDSGLPVPFVGLTASWQQVSAVAESIGVSMSPPVVAANGSVTVDHSAQTYAFVDGKAGLVWTAATAPDDYLQDLKKLVGSR